MATVTLPEPLAQYVTRTVEDANGPRIYLRNGDRAATLDVLRGKSWFVQLHDVDGDRHVYRDRRTYRSEAEAVRFLSKWLEVEA